MSEEYDGALHRFENRRVESVAAAGVTEYVLTLFVSGASDISAQAIGNAKSICEMYLTGRYRLQVVDIHRDVAKMMAHNVLAAPTLMRELPLPMRRLVGDLSDTRKVLAALDIADTLSVAGTLIDANGSGPS